MAGLRDRFVALLTSQAGYHEGRNADGTWNNNQKYSDETPGLEWSDWQPWCATFQAWAAHKLAADALWPMTASCLTAVAWWQQRGRWSSYPVLGGPFYLGPGGGTHTGVVVRYDADTIYTVEGNTNDNGSANGDGVYLRQRPRRGAGSPYGYGVPAWPEGTISADPKLGATPTAATRAVAQPAEEDPLMAFTEADLDRIVTTAVARFGTPDDVAHSVLYWLSQALSGHPSDAGTHPLAHVIPTLTAQFAALPATVVEPLRSAVETALASTVNVVVSVDTPTSKGN